MKAIEILKCLSYMGESSEQFNVLELTGEKNHEKLGEMFYNLANADALDDLYLPTGNYLWYFTKRFGALDKLCDGKNTFEPDDFVESADDRFVYVYFYKID